jgi:hypothetical protein
VTKKVIVGVFVRFSCAASSMDMDLAVAKLNLAGVAMSRRRKLKPPY